ncbi:MAG: hypothetical protein GW748_05250 [Alphaproteobacteria bacterium]|nr:hypothetical protein [Alphaproteobacteria bacterium]NCQ67133.1 hypothetical protein [Alphaproteobacteria bacterium]NCT07729.1 hypothetical protein [Alphaproteobacteria bacterium]
MKNKLLTLLLCSTAVQAASDIDSSKVQHYTISNTGLTRISIENDAIKDMFAYPSTAYDSLNLHESGHLFVAPAGISEPIYLTMILNSGETQDLKLDFARKAPRPLILKHKDEKRASKEQIDRWLSVALLGETPRGFRRESPKHDKRVSEYATAREIDRFSNGSYEISLCKIISKNPETITITPELFIDQDEGGRVSIPQITSYGEATLAIIKKTTGKK